MMSSEAAKNYSNELQKACKFDHELSRKCPGNNLPIFIYFIFI